MNYPLLERLVIVFVALTVLVPSPHLQAWKMIFREKVTRVSPRSSSFSWTGSTHNQLNISIIGQGVLKLQRAVSEP